MSLKIDDIEGIVEELLRQGGRPVLLEGETIALDIASARDGLLPVFLIAGEALWREVEGESLGLKTERDEGALLGFRLTEILCPSFSAVMLPTMEAIAQVARPEGIIVDDLGRVWEESNARLAEGPVWELHA